MLFQGLRRPCCTVPYSRIGPYCLSCIILFLFLFCSSSLHHHLSFTPFSSVLLLLLLLSLSSSFSPSLPPLRPTRSVSSQLSVCRSLGRVSSNAEAAASSLPLPSFGPPRRLPLPLESGRIPLYCLSTRSRLHLPAVALGLSTRSSISCVYVGRVVCLPSTDALVLPPISGAGLLVSCWPAA